MRTSDGITQKSSDPFSVAANSTFMTRKCDLVSFVLDEKVSLLCEVHVPTDNKDSTANFMNTRHISIRQSKILCHSGSYESMLLLF